MIRSSCGNVMASRALTTAPRHACPPRQAAQSAQLVALQLPPTSMQVHTHFTGFGHSSSRMCNDGGRVILQQISLTCASLHSSSSMHLTANATHRHGTATGSGSTRRDQPKPESSIRHGLNIQSRTNDPRKIESKHGVMQGPGRMQRWRAWPGRSGRCSPASCA